MSGFWVSAKKSAPAQKLVSVPVTTRTFTSSSSLACWIMETHSPAVAELMAFRFSGLFRVMRATLPLFS